MKLTTEKIDSYLFLIQKLIKLENKYIRTQAMNDREIFIYRHKSGANKQIILNETSFCLFFYSKSNHEYLIRS